jgi:hypothetical protein
MTSIDEITCYTDGSFCDNRSGAGAFSDTLKLEESYPLGTYTTVFQVEFWRVPTSVRKQDFKIRQFINFRTVKLP